MVCCPGLVLSLPSLVGLLDLRFSFALKAPQACGAVGGKFSHLRESTNKVTNKFSEMFGGVVFYVFVSVNRLQFGF